MEDPRDIGTSATVAVAAPSRRDAEEAPPAKLADRYELLGLLGVGGMGAVYRARDAELDEIVALKMLRAELNDDEPMLARFRTEVRLARRVTHPNAARTFDIGEHGRSKLLTMELVDGPSPARTSAFATSSRLQPLPEATAVHANSNAGLRARAIGGANGGSPTCEISSVDIGVHHAIKSRDSERAVRRCLLSR
jgi:serine/threonine-protein kinase